MFYIQWTDTINLSGDKSTSLSIQKEKVNIWLSCDLNNNIKSPETTRKKWQENESKDLRHQKANLHFDAAHEIRSICQRCTVPLTTWPPNVEPCCSLMNILCTHRFIRIAIRYNVSPSYYSYHEDEWWSRCACSSSVGLCGALWSSALLKGNANNSSFTRADAEYKHAHTKHQVANSVLEGNNGWTEVTAVWKC